MKNHQNGFASILVVLTLVAGMATLAITASRSSLLEQLIAGNDLRAKEAHMASEAFLDYVIAWAQQNSIPASINCTSASPGCPPLPSMVSDNDSGAFTLSAVFTITEVIPNKYIKIEAKAEQTDNKSKATTSCVVKIEGTAAPYKVSKIPGTWKDF